MISGGREEWHDRRKGAEIKWCGMPDSPTDVLGLRRNNGTINSVGSERYGAMPVGRNLSLYTETRVSEGLSTEWMLSVSPT